MIEECLVFGREVEKEEGDVGDRNAHYRLYDSSWIDSTSVVVVLELHRQ